MIVVHAWWLVPLLLIVFFWGPFGRPRRYGSDVRRVDRSRATVRELDEAVRARLASIDQLETRVAELENRLDFAERLLAGRQVETQQR